ncbi:hypothetical protein GCM10020001_064720 [Nonomuraea salmonea]
MGLGTDAGSVERMDTGRGPVAALTLCTKPGLKRGAGWASCTAMSPGLAKAQGLRTDRSLETGLRRDWSLETGLRRDWSLETGLGMNVRPGLATRLCC